MSCTEFIQVKFGFSLMDSRWSRSMTRPWYVHWRSDTVCHKYTSSTDWRQMVRSEVKPLISADSLWQGQTHICLPSLESKGEKETKKKKKRGATDSREASLWAVSLKQCLFIWLSPPSNAITAARRAFSPSCPHEWLTLSEWNSTGKSRISWRVLPLRARVGRKDWAQNER